MGKAGRPPKLMPRDFAEITTKARYERRANPESNDRDKYGHLEGSYDEPNDPRIDY